MADIPINSQGRDLLQQWDIQIDIPAIWGAANDRGIRVDTADAPGEGIDAGKRKDSQAEPTVKKKTGRHRDCISKFMKGATADIPTALPLK